MVEAGVTIICACMFGSKPVVMLLIPDRLIAKVKPIGRHSLRYYRSNLVQRARSGRSKISNESSSPRSDDVALRDQPIRAARYDLENYGAISDIAYLDNSRSISEPSQAKLRHANGEE